jgi:hypothetical protein
VQILFNATTHMRPIFKVCFLVLILGFQSCQTGIQEKLFNKIVKDCPNKDTCIVSLNSITDFKWDTVYIFDPSNHLEAIDKVLGFHYEYWEDIANRIIFTEKRAVVYHEDHFPKPSEPEKNKVFFSFDSDSIHYMKLTAKDAIFLAVRNKVFKLSYELKRLKSAPNEPAASMRGIVVN